jgi:hypothetical protein
MTKGHFVDEMDWILGGFAMNLPFRASACTYHFFWQYFQAWISASELVPRP